MEKLSALGYVAGTGTHKSSGIDPKTRITLTVVVGKMP